MRLTQPICKVLQCNKNSHVPKQKKETKQKHESNTFCIFQM